MSTTPRIGPALQEILFQNLRGSGKSLSIYPYPDSKAVVGNCTILMRSDATRPREQICTLAHEITHIIQELSGTLNETQDPEFDLVCERDSIQGTDLYPGENAFRSYYGLPLRTDHNLPLEDETEVDYPLDTLETLESGILLESLWRMKTPFPVNDAYIEKVNVIVKHLSDRSDKTRLVSNALAILGNRGQEHHLIDPALVKKAEVSFDSLHSIGAIPSIPYCMASTIPDEIIHSKKISYELEKSPLLHLALCVLSKYPFPPSSDLYYKRIIPHSFPLYQPIPFNITQIDLFRRCIRASNYQIRTLTSLMETTPHLAEVVKTEIGSDLQSHYEELRVSYHAGAGNSLEIRGEGPGMSWEKGMPMTLTTSDTWSILHTMPKDCPYKLVLRTPEGISWENGENRLYQISYIDPPIFNDLS
ncbi:MAG: hypothetical protein KBC64_06330 [Simkaniaceae bacterium]|nr:hypothetical protein [Simkaniaceae bacterium]